MRLRKFISELIRRNVFKAVIAYLAIAWVIIQIASIVLPTFDAPDYSLKVLIYILAFGLILWIIFSWVYDLTSEGFKKTENIANSDEVSKQNSKRLNKIIAVSLFLAIVLLISASFWAGSKWNQGDFIKDSKKVAVIPFTAKTEELDAFFITGMTDALIEELSKVDELSVISQESTKFLSTPLSQANMLIVNEINDIDYFIEGTINQNLNTLEVLINLKEELESESTWSKAYSDDITQVKKLWSQVAIDLSREMEIEITQSDLSQLANLKPIRPETYELYLKGKHHLIKSTPLEWQKGLLYLEEAINKNPSDSYTYSGLAEGLIMLGHGPNPPPDVFPKAREAAMRAIQLDSTNAEGWAALSHYHTYFGWDWELAEHAFNRANDLNPNLAYNHYHRAWYLALFGRMNEAIDEHKLAQELDPFTPLHTAWLGELYRMVGLYEEGLIEAEKASQMQNDYALGMLIKGKIFMDQGKTDEGLQLLKEASDINPAWKYIGYGPELIKTGKVEDAIEIIKELENLPVSAYSALCLGIMYSELGNQPKAIEWFSFDQKHGWYPWIRVMSENNDIVNNEKFLELIREMNLPDPSPIVYTSE